MRWIITMALCATLTGGAFGETGRFDSNVQKREFGGKTADSERDEQAALYDYYFRGQKLKYETRYDALKSSAAVPSWRVPYSASIHPQSYGGMSSLGARGRGGNYSPLSAYDRAFNNGSGQANAYEVQRLMSGRGLLPATRLRRGSEPWEGYCSGFTASTIRHPEPIRAVDAGDVGGTPGVIFQPSDIKALLSAIYNRTTNDSYLYVAPPSAGDGGPNMGTFHLALANYIGQAGHPIGIDRTRGRAAWNNPIYAYEVNSAEDAGEENGIRFKRVQTTVTYTFYGSDGSQQTNADSGEVQGNQKQTMVFNYLLALDGAGRIVGGLALSNSGYFLWVPLYAVQAKADGSAPGNPHLDVRKVIALARASALPETQTRFDEAAIGPRFDPATEGAE